MRNGGCRYHPNSQVIRYGECMCIGRRFLADLSWHDVSKLAQDRRTVELSDQLFRAVGSVHASIAEGYSHRSGKDQARFCEYALGSTREARG